MLKLVCHALINIEIEWQYDQKEMKLKCRTKVDDEKLVDDDKFIEDFIRQQFLKFYVYVNKLVKNSSSTSNAPKKRGPPAAQNVDSSGKTIQSDSSKNATSGDTYILNLYLQKGTIPVFLEMANEFFNIIQTQLSSQDRGTNYEDQNMDHAMTATNTNRASSNNENEMMDHDGKPDKKQKFPLAAN